MIREVTRYIVVCDADGCTLDTAETDDKEES